MVRVFVILKTEKKMVLNIPLLNTHHYNVRIKGKAEQSMEKGSILPNQLDVVGNEKGTFG